MLTKEFYEQYYKKIDTRGSEWRELTASIKARNIATMVDGLTVNSVIDIGCGTGSVLSQLAKIHIGKHYHVVDIANQAISIVKERGDIPNLLEASVFDGLNLPYGNQQFDLAILSHVVEHLKDPVSLLVEAARVSRYVVVEVPLEDNLYTHLKVKLFRSRYREELGHIQWFNPVSFRNLLEHKAGLTVINMKMAYIPDEVYMFRRQEQSQRLLFGLLKIRKMLRSISNDLYASLLTDHCIALVCSA